MPNLWVVRPGDAHEAVEAWRLAMSRQDGPVALVLTRQKLPVLNRTRFASAGGVSHGAYVLADPPGRAPDAIVIATGSEIHVALAAYERLLREGIWTRVVSMPCWEVFERQGESYRELVLPSRITARVSLEAGATFGWHRWVGDRGASLGIDHFGASAPGEVNMREFGFTPERVAELVLTLLVNKRRSAA